MDPCFPGAMARGEASCVVLFYHLQLNFCSYSNLLSNFENKFRSNCLDLKEEQYLLYGLVDYVVVNQSVINEIIT